MANEPNEDEPLFHAATYTQAPKVSHKVLTKEERQVLIKQHEEKQQEAAKLDQVASKGPVGRWWSRLQSGPNRITPAMAIVALGVVYGDIGTSPLYTMQTFLNGQGGLAHADREAVLGVLSLVFWSITLITTVKYVLIAMRIDNKGEGGIFALYSLVRKYGAWLAIPAMLGGAAFLADSVLTPAVSISSAVEGLETLPAFEKLFTENKQLTLMITAAIILMLFSVQSRGTERIGKAFGSVVLVWFSFLAVVGLANLSQYWSVFAAQGTPESRITYFSANPNGEAEIIKVTLKPNPRVRRIIFEHDFSEVSIKGRQARGVILTRLPVHKISLKQKGGSTLGGRKVWFDRDILRLNYDGRGEYLGEFQSDDSILIVLNNGDFYTTNFDLSNHYEDNVSIVEKFDPNKIWTAALYDADQQNYPYLKRFCFEASNRKQNYLGENKSNRLILLTDEYYPRLEVIFGGHDNFRDPLNIDADEFIAVKGFKAKGKRITTYAVETINELEPTRFPEPSQEQQEVPEEEPENLDPDSGKSEGDIIDEITGQMKLF